MRISFSWLKKHVAIPESLTPTELAEKLKLSTVEVEGVDYAGAHLDKIVVGKVLSAEKHPNADSLQVCQVDTGAETVTIVCGGSNVVPNMYVAVAQTGAKVRWHGEGELIELKPAKIRGVESNGMICGADEIGLAERFPKKSEKEIVDLGSLKVRAGEPLAKVLNLSDAIFEIDNKSLSNRPDLWGHYGLAREVAALTGRPLQPYKTTEIKKGKGVDLKIKNTDTKACPRYMAVALSGVVVAPSPRWLEESLLSVGVRPINNVVDATNFVMLDLGQPLHAFDASVVPGGEVIVRSAKHGEKITTLDDKERELEEGMLLIAGKEKPLAIAGIMGGKDSGITGATTTVIIESAHFLAESIRKTSTKLGLRTDASARFEKSLDVTLPKIALERVVALIQEITPAAKVASVVVDEGVKTAPKVVLTMPSDFCEKKIGLSVPGNTVVAILSRLGFDAKEKKGMITVAVPSWRTKDVSRAEDIVEEVLRVVGYSAVSASLPNFPITPPAVNTLSALSRTIRRILALELGYNETYNYSFVSASQIVKLGEDVKLSLELDNPLSKEKPLIRRSLVPNLLENIATNATRGSVRLFEIGQVYTKENPGLRALPQGDELLPRQDTWFGAVFMEKKNSNPFSDARRVVEALQKYVPITLAEARGLTPSQHPTRTASIRLRGETIGSIYEVHPQVRSAYGLEERVAVVEINLSTLVLSDAMVGTKYSPLSAYPTVKRDVAMVVKKDITHEMVQKALKNADPLLLKVELFDVYRGATIGAEYKSMAYHLTYGSDSKTLTTEEVDTAHAKIIAQLVKKCGAEMRA
jgi:phenylalanyl-tRNA synthetase beta chain